MGMTKDNLFDSLMDGIQNNLLAYWNTSSPKLHTLKQTRKLKIVLGNDDSVCEIEYCVNGAINDFPKPIKEFLEKTIVVTDPSYKSKKKMLITK